MMNDLKTILRNTSIANFFISTPRVGYFKPETEEKFVEKFNKRESTKMHAERISPQSGETVQIWIRSYTQNTYMIVTDANNVIDYDQVTN